MSDLFGNCNPHYKLHPFYFIRIKFIWSVAGRGQVPWLIILTGQLYNLEWINDFFCGRIICSRLVYVLSRAIRKSLFKLIQTARGGMQSD